MAHSCFLVDTISDIYQLHEWGITTIGNFFSFRKNTAKYVAFCIWNTDVLFLSDFMAFFPGKSQKQKLPLEVTYGGYAPFL